MNMKKIFSLLIMSLLLLMVFACPPKDRTGQLNFLLENKLDEEVKVIGFNLVSPSVQNTEEGELVLESMELLLLNSFDYTPPINEVLGATLEITSADSIVFQFEDGKHIGFNKENTNSLNPLNFNSSNTAWTTIEVGEDLSEARFSITQAHKDAAN